MKNKDKIKKSWNHRPTEHICEICENKFWCDGGEYTHLDRCRECIGNLDNFSHGQKQLFEILLKRLHRLEEAGTNIPVGVDMARRVKKDFVN